MFFVIKKLNVFGKILIVSVCIASLLFLSVRLDLIKLPKIRAAGSFSLELFPTGIILGGNNTMNLGIQLRSLNGFSGNVRVEVSVPGGANLEVSSLNDHLLNWDWNGGTSESFSIPINIPLNLGSKQSEQYEYNFIAPTISFTNYGTHTINVTASSEGAEPKSGSVTISNIDSTNLDSVFMPVNDNKISINTTNNNSSASTGISYVFGTYTGTANFSCEKPNAPGVSCSFSDDSVNVTSSSGESSTFYFNATTSTPNGYYLGSIKTRWPGGAFVQQQGVRVKVTNSSTSNSTNTDSSGSSTSSSSSSNSDSTTSSSSSSTSSAVSPVSSAKTSQTSSSSLLTKNNSQAQISLSADSGLPGDKIKISGSKFLANTELVIWWDPYVYSDNKQGGKADIGRVTTNKSGSFKDLEITIPSDWISFIGTHTIMATNGKVNDGESSGAEEFKITEREEISSEEIINQKIIETKSNLWFNQTVQDLTETKTLTLNLANIASQTESLNQSVPQEEYTSAKKITAVKAYTSIGKQECNLISDNLTYFLPGNLQLATYAFAQEDSGCEIKSLGESDDAVTASILGSLSIIDKLINELNNNPSTIKLAAARVITDYLRKFLGNGYYKNKVVGLEEKLNTKNSKINTLYEKTMSRADIWPQIDDNLPKQIFLKLSDNSEIPLYRSFEFFQNDREALEKLVKDKISLEIIENDLPSYSESQINEVVIKTISVINYLYYDIIRPFSNFRKEFDENRVIDTTQIFTKSFEYAGIRINWQGNQWKFLAEKEKETVEQCLDVFPYILGKPSFYSNTDDNVPTYQAESFDPSNLDNNIVDLYRRIHQADYENHQNKIKQINNQKNQINGEISGLHQETNKLKELDFEQQKINREIKYATSGWLKGFFQNIQDIFKYNLLGYKQGLSQTSQLKTIEINKRIEDLEKKLLFLDSDEKALILTNNREIISWYVSYMNELARLDEKQFNEHLEKCKNNLTNNPFLGDLIKKINSGEIKIDDVLSWSGEGIPMGAININSNLSTGKIDRLIGQANATNNDVNTILLTNYLIISTDSPVALLITDPLNRLIGWDPISQKVINQIENSSYSGINTTKSQLFIPGIYQGKYNIRIMGLEDTDYKVKLTLAANEQIIDKEFSGKVKKNEFVDGEISTEFETKSVVIENKIKNFFSDFWKNPIKWGSALAILVAAGLLVLWFVKYRRKKANYESETIN